MKAKTYETKRFSVTVEPIDQEMACQDLKDFKWVRLYANAWTVEYLGESKILLSCESGTEPAGQLLAKARASAIDKLELYKQRAAKILEIEI